MPPMKTDTPRPIRLKDYQPSPYLIETVDLEVALDPKHTRVRSRLKLRPNPAIEDAGGPLRLDGEMLELDTFKLDGKAVVSADYEIGPGALTLHRPPNKPSFTLDIVTHINPEANKALQGLYRSRGIYTTQCEAQGFRRITYFLDRPDVLATYTTRIEASLDDAAVLLGNGNPVERGQLAAGQSGRGRRHYAVWKDPHQALLPVRAGRRQPRLGRSRVPHRVRPRRRPPDLRRARQGGACALGDGLPEALDALGREAVRPRV